MIRDTVSVEQNLSIHHNATIHKTNANGTEILESKLFSKVILNYSHKLRPLSVIRLSTKIYRTKETLLKQVKILGGSSGLVVIYGDSCF